MKKYLIVYYGDAPECVEGFHKSCKRSGKGALHVKPGRQMTVTEDELKHLKECKSCKHMLPKLRVLGEKVEAPKKEDKSSKDKEEKGEAKADKKADDKSEATQEGSKATTRKKASRKRS